jgi:alpha-1,2-mannosyltransferase
LSDVYVDTMGYAFTYPIFRYLGGCSVACYTHYPTISTDMIAKVSSGEAAHNHRAWIAKNPVLTTCKQFYYDMFALLYGWMGRRAQVVMVNSTWTKGHVDKLWFDFEGGRDARGLVSWTTMDTSRVSFSCLPLLWLF